jgi:hypothetical protein
LLQNVTQKKYTRERERKGEMRNAYKILVRKPEGKKPHRRSQHRWEDNIKLGLWEIG